MEFWKTFAYVCLILVSLLTLKDLYLAYSGYSNYNTALQTAAIANTHLESQQRRLQTLSSTEAELNTCIGRLAQHLDVQEQYDRASLELSSLRELKKSVIDYNKLAVDLRNNADAIDNLIEKWNKHPPKEDDSPDLEGLHKLQLQLLAKVSSFETSTTAYRIFMTENQATLKELGNLVLIKPEQLIGHLKYYKETLEKFGKFLRQNGQPAE